MVKTKRQRAHRRNMGTSSSGVKKNKIILLLLEHLGFGWFGLDRIYMGCFTSGIIKFMLPFLGLMIAFVGGMPFVGSVLILLLLTTMQ